MKLKFTGPDALLRIESYEGAELAQPLGILKSELTAQTEPMLCRRIRSGFKLYLKHRGKGRYHGPLLRELLRDVGLYQLIRPMFWPHTIDSISDLQALVDHLPEEMHSPWRNGDELPVRA